MVQKRLNKNIETILGMLAQFQIETPDGYTIGNHYAVADSELDASYTHFKWTIADKFGKIAPRPKFVNYHPDYLSKNAHKLVSAIDSGYWEVATCDVPQYPHPLGAMVSHSQIPEWNYCFNRLQSPGYFPPTWNAVFRAYHDFYGHYKNRFGFDTLSEIRVVINHELDFPTIALDALLSESLLQTAVYHVTGNYAEQKALKLTEEIKELWNELKTLVST
jgi:hypothetical protein